MRTCALVCVTVALALPAGVGALSGGLEKKEKTDPVADLIKQLGDEQFAKRAAASKALAKIGEPALAALRKAAGSSDAEVRRRAGSIVEAIENDLGYLFNGKDLMGWQVESGDARQWKVEGGAIVAESKDYRTRNYLLSTHDYADFTLRFEFMLDPGSGGGVVLRGLVGEKIVDACCDHGIVKFTDPEKFPAYCSGTTHFLKDDKQYCRPTDAPNLPAGAWHAVAITVRGDTCIAVLAGKKAVDIRLDPNYRGALVPTLNRIKGKVGFQAHTGTIRFRSVRIEQLKP